MTTKCDITSSFGLISTLASLGQDEFIKTDMTGLQLLFNELTSTTMAIEQSKELKKCKQQLTRIEGMLESMPETAMPDCCKSALKTVRELHRFLKQSNGKKVYFETHASQEALRELDIDSCITKRLWMTLDAGSSGPAIQPCISVVEGELVLSPKFADIVDDKMLSLILEKSKALFPQIHAVTKFDFSKCRRLSLDAPALIKASLPTLERRNFSCLAKKRFCNASFMAQEKQIPVNQLFLASQSALCAGKEGTFFVSGYTADEVKDFIEFLIGKQDLSEKKNLPRLLQVMRLARAVNAEALFKEACDTFENSLNFLAKNYLENDLEIVSYEWLSKLNRAVHPSIKEVGRKISDLAFQKIDYQIHSGNQRKWGALETELETISKYPHFPDLSDICERLSIEESIPQTTSLLPYPKEKAQFLETVSKKYPENKQALYLLGRLQLVSWVDRPADQGMAKRYLDQIPFAFAIERNLLTWQHHEPN